jgi:glycosyltransferase involved in cell wall biosynthesis
LQFSDALSSLGIRCRFLALLSDNYLATTYEGESAYREVASCYAKRLSRLTDIDDEELVWIEKELLPLVPAAIELRLLRGRRFVVDFDDAIFHNYDLSQSALVRRMLGRKIDTLMAAAQLVTVGNRYLEERALRAGAKRVERLPSVVDLNRYPDSPPRQRLGRGAEPLRLVWVGSPSTARYLEALRRPVESLAARMQLELHVIGATAPAWHRVAVRAVPWSLEGEAGAIAACDVGVMPLIDTPWERGKCGYKLIKYMSCGLPVVASPVGANVEIVSDGVDGFLASTDEQWQDSLARLGEDAALRFAMGKRGRGKVEAYYSVQAIAPRFAALLREAAL